MGNNSLKHQQVPNAELMLQIIQFYSEMENHLILIYAFIEF